MNQLERLILIRSLTHTLTFSSYISPPFDQPLFQAWKEAFKPFYVLQLLFIVLPFCIPIHTDFTKIFSFQKKEKILAPFSSQKFLTLSKIQNMKIFNVFKYLVFIFRKYVLYLNLVENKE